MYSSAVIISARCLCRPPLRFDATDAAFPLINQCISINTSFVGSPPTFGRMGVRKYMSTLSTLLVSPTILSCTLVGIYGSWDNLSNVLKAICRSTKHHWHVQLKFDYTTLCLLLFFMVNPRLVWLTLSAYDYLGLIHCLRIVSKIHHYYY